MAGVDVPVWPCEHFYLLTNPVEGISGNLPTLSDHDSHLYIRDDSGGLLIGCFEPMGKSIDPRQIGGQLLASRMGALLPRRGRQRLSFAFRLHFDVAHPRLQLQQFRGKCNVLLLFYPLDWTPT